jgi:hypothetical protein
MRITKNTAQLEQCPQRTNFLNIEPESTKLEPRLSETASTKINDYTGQYLWRPRTHIFCVLGTHKTGLEPLENLLYNWDPKRRKKRFGAPYALPMDLRYFFDLRSPILDAFFLTASVGRPSCAAILAVGLVEKSLLSRLVSAFDHGPFIAFFLFTVFLLFVTFFFFAILCFLSLKGIRLNLSLCFSTATTRIIYGWCFMVSRFFSNFKTENVINQSLTEPVVSR